MSYPGNAILQVVQLHLLNPVCMVSIFSYIRNNYYFEIEVVFNKYFEWKY